MKPFLLAGRLFAYGADAATMQGQTCNNNSGTEMTFNKQ
jgi:hypothetical protein